MNLESRFVICIQDKDSRNLLKKGVKYEVLSREYRADCSNETPHIEFDGFSLMLKGLEDYWFKESRFEEIDPKFAEQLELVEKIGLI